MIRRQRPALNALLSALQDGPGTSSELSGEIGQSIRYTSALLSYLHRKGQVARSTEKQQRARWSPGAWVYSVPTKEISV